MSEGEAIKAISDSGKESGTFKKIMSSMFGWLVKPKTSSGNVKNSLVTGALAGVGMYAGAKVAKGIGGFLRSFFPYDKYDWLVFSTFILHIFIDGFMFGYNYSNQTLITFHLYFVIFWVIFLSLYRDEGEILLVSVIQNTILFGMVFLLESWMIPWLKINLRSTVFDINRILVPIWPIFTIMYTTYKRKIGTPYIKRVVGIVIIIYLFIAGPYIVDLFNKFSSQVDVSSSQEIATAKRTADNIWEGLTTSVSNSWNFFKSLINGSFIEEQIEPFKYADPGQYAEDQVVSAGLQIVNVMASPYVIDIERNPIVELSFAVNFIIPNEVFVPEKVFQEEGFVKVKGIYYENGNELKKEMYSCKPEKFPLLESRGYKNIICEINISAGGSNIRFNEKNQLALYSKVSYDFFTLSEKQFYFLDENILQAYFIENKDPYLEEAGFSYPTSTENSGGPILIGINANKEMEIAPLPVSSNPEDDIHKLKIFLNNKGKGEIERVKMIYLYVPEGIELKEGLFKKSNNPRDCYEKLGLNSAYENYVCYISNDNIDFNLYKIGKNYDIDVNFIITQEVLDTYKSKKPILSRVDYEYTITTDSVVVSKK